MREGEGRRRGRGRGRGKGRACMCKAVEGLVGWLYGWHQVGRFQLYACMHSKYGNMYMYVLVSLGTRQTWEHILSHRHILLSLNGGIAITTNCICCDVIVPSLPHTPAEKGGESNTLTTVTTNITTPDMFSSPLHPTHVH